MKPPSGIERITMTQALIALCLLLAVLALLSFFFTQKKSDMSSLEEITLSPEEAKKTEVRAQLVELALEPQPVANPVTGSGMARDSKGQSTHGTESLSVQATQPTEDEKEATRALLRQAQF